jgi:plastocyanin
MVALGLATSVSAQSSPTSTSSAPAATWTVGVGRGDHKFEPDLVQASVGDIIQFDFFPPNHSVVRAE